MRSISVIHTILVQVGIMVLLAVVTTLTPQSHNASLCRSIS